MLRRAAVTLCWFLAGAVLSAQNWPSFRGPAASGVADGKEPTAVKWNTSTGENILWKTPLAGVAVSSPIVWGDRVFVSTAVSSDPAAGIRTGLYGDVEPAKDVSKHSWKLVALDKRTGKVLWERVAHEGIPKTKRHPKSSQATATPVTDGRHVIVSFGSEGCTPTTSTASFSGRATSACSMPAGSTIPTTSGASAARRSSGRTSSSSSATFRRTRSLPHSMSRPVSRRGARRAKKSPPGRRRRFSSTTDGPSWSRRPRRSFAATARRAARSCGGLAGIPKSRSRRRSSGRA